MPHLKDVCPLQGAGLARGAMAVEREEREKQVGHELTDVERHRAIERELRVDHVELTGGHDAASRVQVTMQQRFAPLAERCLGSESCRFRGAVRA